MKKIIRTATVAVISILLAAGISCTDNEQFRVNGTIEGKPTINLRAAYWADGAYRQLLTASRDGEFEFFGSSKTPAVVDIMDHEYRVIGRIYIANGQNVECTLDRSNPFNISASGNETVEKWTRFLKENADSLRSGSGTANAIIGRYVKANPADVVSTLLMLTAFDASADPAGADSLLFSIDVSARPSSLTSGYNFLLERLITAADTINPIVYFDAATGKGATFRPEDSGRSMIVFSTEDSPSRDSLLTAMRRLRRKYEKKELEIVDISLDRDTVVWKNHIRRDSATWRQGWAAGAMAAPGINCIGINRLPFAVVCDSAGATLYRGPSIASAEKAADI